MFRGRILSMTSDRTGLWTAKRLVGTVCSVCLISAIAASCAESGKLPVQRLEIATAAGTVVGIEAEIARTDAEKEKGYMDRKKIPDGTGMIFSYRSDQQMRFWMKNTPHPLSIAFIDASGVIREVYDMTPFSLETVASVRAARFALEVPQGWFERAGIVPGDWLTPDSVEKIR